ncbi:glycosyl hydrolase family 71-domain-containing protein [Cadophora sp. MPI-SDFR-AT-0126]|nr:glycosyl hydrolase family 71-domain-containing protein [Leotiomycetes sp. MPI-SDFR-AT-0126]
MAYGDTANTNGLSLAFQAAAQVGFKVFFSFDYAGLGAWPKATVTEMIKTYGGRAEYFKHSTGQPLVSTFEGPSNAADWHQIKADTGCFFVPSWSSLGARKAVQKADHVVDGTTRTNWELDASYLIFLNNTGSYMASVSPWVFTNMPGYNKNWVWRGENTWSDRWNQLMILAQLGADQWPNEPEYIQIISWNDFGESHYIGPLNKKAYVAFGPDRGNAPFNYVENMPHDGWRLLLPYMITMWKTGSAVVTQEAAVMCRQAPGRACDSGGTTGNTASQVQAETTPWSLLQDRVYFTVLSGAKFTPRVEIGGTSRSVVWDFTPDASLGSVGLYSGHIDWDGAYGAVKFELLSESGSVVMTLMGAVISPICTNAVQNWNAWVGSAVGRSMSVSPALNMKDQKCVDGSGSTAEFVELCDMTCKYGYCPPRPCTCFKMGKGIAELDPVTVGGKPGFPLAGSECTFLGLCDYACNHGFCPSSTCTTDTSAKGKCYIPIEDPDPEDPEETSCTSGTGLGNVAGLCDFSCGRGYCPLDVCICTGRGPAITPPAATKPAGYPASGLGSDYVGLCNFACSHDYCPAGACSYVNPYGSISFELPPCSKDNKEIDCTDVGCSIDESYKESARWDAVGGNTFFDYTVTWFGDYNDFNPNPATGAQPFTGTPWLNNPVEAVAYFFAGKNSAGGSKISSDLNCGVLSSSNGCSDLQSFVCGTTDIPALDLLLTSFVNVHNFSHTMYEALDSVQNGLDSIIENVAATFWKVNVGLLGIFLKIPGVFSMILTVAAAGFWSSVLGVVALDGVTDGAATAAGAVDFFAKGFQYIADKRAASAVSQIEVETNLKSASLQFFTQTREVLDEWMKTAFNGDWQDYRNLGTHVENGLFLKDRSVLSFDWYTTMTPVVTGMSIVEAWRQKGPVAIIYENGDKVNPSNSLVSGSAETMRVKVPDGDYTLWIATTGTCGGSGGSDCIGGAVMPTGLDSLVDASNKWGVTKDDIALSSFYGYMLGGKKNPYSISNNKAKGLNPTNTGPLPFDSGLRTPGVFGIPVCTTEVFRKNLQDDKDCDQYPCRV